MAATIAQRIQDFVGFDYSDNSINTENEAIEISIAEVIDSLSSELLLKYSLVPINLVGGSLNMDIKGKKVLKVIRFDADIIGRVCDKVDIDEFKHLVKDTNSIYYPTAHSPIYTEDPGSGAVKLEVFPSPSGSEDGASSAKIYYIPYTVGDIDGYTSLDGIPNEVEHAIALKASMYILQILISDAIQDDEDSEMLQMQQAQMQSLQGMYQVEMQRLSGEKGEQ